MSRAAPSRRLATILSWTSSAPRRSPLSLVIGAGGSSSAGSARWSAES